MNQVDILAKKNAELILRLQARDHKLMMSRSECLNTKKELEKMRQTIQMMQGTAQLDEILKQGKPAGETTGLGYDNSNRNSSTQKKVPIFVQAYQPKGQDLRGFNSGMIRNAPEPSHRYINKGEKLKEKENFAHDTPTDFAGHLGLKTVNQFVEHKSRLVNKRESERFVPICCYCNHPGHIRPFCRFYLGDKRMQVTLNAGPRGGHGKLHRGYVVHTCNKSIMGNVWYVDSGYSKHMTSNKNFLIDLKLGSSDRVTFADGVKSSVLGSGTLNVPGMPPLKKVLYVEGLTSNLISISQLCDEGLDVKFDSKWCVITKDKAEYIMGKRSGNDCYLVTPTMTCNFVKLTTAEIWHQKLRHTNYRNLQKLVKVNAIRGLPAIKDDQVRICGPCLIAK